MSPPRISRKGNPCQKYISQVQTLLQSPHATRFLLEGGLIWRLAIAYGPPGMYPRNDTEQSTSTPNQGDMVLTDWVSGPLFEHEIDTLLGKISDSNHTIYPPFDLFSTSHFFHGEWTADIETWFLNWSQQIEDAALHPDDHDFEPKSPRQWKNQFSRKAGLKDVPAKLWIGTSEHAAQLLCDLAEAYPDVVNRVAETYI